MDRDQYLADACVHDFLHFFSRCLSNLEVSYASGFPRIRPQDRNFHSVGVMQALASYAWPATDTFHGPPHPQLYDWQSTSNFLSQARLALQTAIATRNEPATLDAAIRILKWGLTPNGVRANIMRLNQITHARGITWYEYFEDVRGFTMLAAADTNNISEGLIPYASSGTCKIHSLASNDGLVIFDSRVAAMLGECINEFLRRGLIANIPESLKIFIELNHRGTHQRRPMPLLNGSNHGGFSRDHRWIECQIRVSWLFEEVLNLNTQVFFGLPLPERMHRLEAACFMMGAYLEPGPFNGRTFNFNAV